MTRSEDAVAGMPTPSQVWRAIGIWLAQAYDGPPPRSVHERLDALRPLEGSAFWSSPLLEREPREAPRCYRLRLGNRCYPHMKLVVQTRPDGGGFLFGADTHDGHICPPADSADHAPFRELMARNQEVAAAIEAAWEAEGVLTFKGWLRSELARLVARQPAGA